MRKIFSSIFILLLLLVSLWGMGAWLFGTKTENSFNKLIEHNQHSSDQVFHYELLKYDRSIFGAKASIQIDLNMENKLAQFFSDSNELDQNQNIINIDIYHGPFLFDSSGVSLGSSSWKLSFDKNFDKDKITSFLQIQKFIQSPIAKVIIGLNDVIEYKVPLITSSSKSQITGSYNLKTDIHEGNLSSSQLLYQGEKQKLQVTEFILNYKQPAASNDKKNLIKLTANIQELVYTHDSITEKVVSNLSYHGNISLENNVLNSDNKFLLSFDGDTNAINYPIDMGDLMFKITDLNFDDLIQLNSVMSRLNDLNKKSQWILEEQGELPEGQDQIWQIQDSAERYANKLPKLVNKLLSSDELIETKLSVKDNNNSKPSKINFLFKSKYRDKKSDLNGAIYADTIHPNEMFSSRTIFSLIQAQAQVSLGEEWLRYLSSRFPIKNSNFKLIYKKNKLLMQ